MQTSTPAKLILSGEHSVVYGAPAIGTPLDLSLTIDWQTLPDQSHIKIKFKDEEVVLAKNWEDFAEKLGTYCVRYAAFQEGVAPIHDVLPGPYDLAALTLGSFYARFKPDLPGLMLSIKTDIPIAAGLGSSSALIINLLQGLQQLTGVDMEMLDFAREIENFQHGTSSGMDLALVMSQTPLVFTKEKDVIESLPSVSTDLLLVHTGKPIVSTGDCVSYVRDHYANDNGMWADFSDCTAQVKDAWIQNNAYDLYDAVVLNQQLLTRIGVVPEKVQRFVAECAAESMAAKICGAGAVKGDSAGMVWVLAEEGQKELLKNIVKGYGYQYGSYHTK